MPIKGECRVFSMHIRKEVISERARRCGIVGEGTTNSPRDAERRYLWVVKLEVMATTLQQVGLCAGS